MMSSRSTTKSSAGDGNPARTLTPHMGNARACTASSKGTGRGESKILYIFTV
ncbi:hypothetical protein D3C72_1968020 [compost metagenome]